MPVTWSGCFLYSREMLDSTREALLRYFGFREFLEGQEEALRAILEGRDALVVMPTGGGKSLCYQLPAMMMEGIELTQMKRHRRGGGKRPGG